MVKLEQIEAVVREAATLMVREGFSVKEKGSVENIVTSSDLAVQKFLTEKLSALLPGSGFLCGWIAGGNGDAYILHGRTQPY